jgi:AcrR family transcriptional regulator
MTKTKRDSYHHGDLRSALISAAEEIIAAEGVEGFTLRKAARKAGVSPGAPTHHFGSMAGLLTQVARRSYEALGRQRGAARADRRLC